MPLSTSRRAVLSYTITVRYFLILCSPDQLLLNAIRCCSWQRIIDYLHVKSGTVRDHSQVRLIQIGQWHRSSVVGLVIEPCDTFGSIDSCKSKTLKNWWRRSNGESRFDYRFIAKYSSTNLQRKGFAFLHTGDNSRRSFSKTKFLTQVLANEEKVLLISTKTFDLYNFCCWAACWCFICRRSRTFAKKQFTSS